MRPDDKAKEAGEHVGAFLRRCREARGLSLGDVSRATKIKESSLVLLEAGRLHELPAAVFVHGFVTAHARAVGADVLDAQRRLKAMLHGDEVAPAPTGDEPVAIRSLLADLRSRRGDDGDKPAAKPDRRRVGVVMVVLLILVVATLTISLMLGQGRRRGPGWSLRTSPSLGSLSGDARA